MASPVRDAFEGIREWMRRDKTPEGKVKFVHSHSLSEQHEVPRPLRVLSPLGLLVAFSTLQDEAPWP